MAVPSNRVPVRVARGLKSALTANLADLLEGELLYAKDEDRLYVVEGGALVAMGADLAASSIDDLSDVTVVTPSNGEALVWNGAAWVNSTVSTVGSIDDLTDVDTTTAAPTSGQVLEWDGANWVPATVAAGGVTSIIAGSGVSVDQATGDVTVTATSAVDSVNGEVGTVVLDLENLDNVAGGTGDPFYSSVSLLLHGEGTNGGTTITDSSQNSFVPATVSGFTTESTQFKFGTHSIAGTGSGSIRYSDNAAFTFGANDFTIETWVRFNTVADGHTFYCHRNYANTNSSLTWFWDQPNGNMRVGWSNTGTSDTTVTWPWSPSADTWYHVALVRNGTNLHCFVDGVEIGTTGSISGTLHDSTAQVYIGSLKLSSGTAYELDGYFDEYRVTNGVARYTSGFTVPSGPFGDTIGIVPTDGQVLTWVDANSQWEPADAASGGGGGTTIAEGFDLESGYIHQFTAGNSTTAGGAQAVGEDLFFNWFDQNDRDTRAYISQLKLSTSTLYWSVDGVTWTQYSYTTSAPLTNQSRWYVSGGTVGSFPASGTVYLAFVLTPQNGSLVSPDAIAVKDGSGWANGGQMPRLEGADVSYSQTLRYSSFIADAPTTAGQIGTISTNTSYLRVYETDADGRRVDPSKLRADPAANSAGAPVVFLWVDGVKNRIEVINTTMQVSYQSNYYQWDTKQDISTICSGASEIFVEIPSTPTDSASLRWNEALSRWESDSTTARVTAGTVPSTNADTGYPGEMRHDATYLYVCVEEDTWKRVAWDTW